MPERTPNRSQARAHDERFMLRALELAERGRGHTAPNPIVGAVIVRGGRVVGEGWHRALGERHAEVEALARAGGAARGATLYVTLEPCVHWGRTPPCVDAILAAGLARCVVALRDPDPRVDGRGLRRLRAAGVKVELGRLAAEAREQLAAYLQVQATGRPRVTWKVASSLDGRIADARGRSKWITGEAARADGHRLRAASDAIVVGAGTARADDPQLTARDGAAPGRRSTRDAQPLRVVVDSRLSLPQGLRLFSAPLARGTVVACTAAAPAARERALVARGVTVWRLPAARLRVSLSALAERLAREGRHEVLLEGGGTLGAAFVRAHLVQRIVLYAAPFVLGGGLSWCDGLSLPLDGAVRGHVVSATLVGARRAPDRGTRRLGMFTGLVEELGRVQSGR
jgi:diaminohydroxyphosphoribosylaminopyrimidine deaminase/5-amino-6-(5-phosphoribosylamino)uracil reductase